MVAAVEPFGGMITENKARIKNLKPIDRIKLSLKTTPVQRSKWLTERIF